MWNFFKIVYFHDATASKVIIEESISELQRVMEIGSLVFRLGIDKSAGTNVPNDSSWIERQGDLKGTSIVELKLTQKTLG